MPAFITYLSLLLLAFGCSDSEFSASSKKQPEPAQDKGPTPDGEPAIPQKTDKEPPNSEDQITEENKLDFDDSETTICGRKGGFQKDLSVPDHEDSFSDWNRHPRMDVGESQVLTVDLENIQGSVLNIAKFTLDDVAFIVPKDVTAASVITLSGNTRTIQIPDSAVLIYDGNSPDYSGGLVNSKGTTVYNYKGKTTVIAPSTKKVKDLFNMGMPFISHKEVDLKKFDNDAYRTGSEISLRVLHVAHDVGFVSITINAEPCKNPS